ncbi:MAG: hypothetical protein JNL01_07835 [Bdellovibrionales bacterium]|nr:hypothetical protein [Bdellovibrionales bacterium]
METRTSLVYAFLCATGFTAPLTFAQVPSRLIQRDPVPAIEEQLKKIPGAPAKLDPNEPLRFQLDSERVMVIRNRINPLKILKSKIKMEGTSCSEAAALVSVTCTAFVPVQFTAVGLFWEKHPDPNRQGKPVQISAKPKTGDSFEVPASATYLVTSEYQAYRELGTDPVFSQKSGFKCSSLDWFQENSIDDNGAKKMLIYRWDWERNESNPETYVNENRSESAAIEVVLEKQGEQIVVSELAALGREGALNDSPMPTAPGELFTWVIKRPGKESCSIKWGVNQPDPDLFQILELRAGIEGVNALNGSKPSDPLSLKQLKGLPFLTTRLLGRLVEMDPEELKKFRSGEEFQIEYK